MLLSMIKVTISLGAIRDIEHLPPAAPGAPTLVGPGAAPAPAARHGLAVAFQPPEVPARGLNR